MFSIRSSSGVSWIFIFGSGILAFGIGAGILLPAGASGRPGGGGILLMYGFYIVLITYLNHLINQELYEAYSRNYWKNIKNSLKRINGLLKNHTFFIFCLFITFSTFL